MSEGNKTRQEPGVADLEGLRDAKNEGWVFLENSSKAHFFGLDGRSLCNKWAYFGGVELNKFEGGSDDSKCPACSRRLAKRTLPSSTHPERKG